MVKFRGLFKPNDNKNGLIQQALIRAFVFLLRHVNHGKQNHIPKTPPAVTIDGTK